MPNIDINSKMNIAKTYTQSTGIVVSYVTENNEIVTQNELSKDYVPFASDRSELISFITSQSKKPPLYNCFHTFLSSFLVTYNVVFQYDHNKYCGSYIVGPILTNEIDNKQLDYIINEKKMKISQKPLLQQSYESIPQYTPSRNFYLGQLICKLCFDSEAEYNQYFYTHNYPVLVKDIAYTQLQNEAETTHIPHLIIKKLENAAMTGNVSEVEKYVDKLFSYPYISLANNDNLRSIKNNFIAVSSDACHIAISGGANYEIAKTTCDEYIRKVETLQTAEDIIILFKMMFKKFTKITVNSLNRYYTKIVHDAIGYIYTNYFNELNLNILSDYLGISPNYLSTLFKKETEMTISQYINKVRVNESKYLLLNTSFSIIEISIATGYNYQNYYTKTFKKLVGVTPMEYRNKRGLLG